MVDETSGKRLEPRSEDNSKKKHLHVLTHTQHFSFFNTVQRFFFFVQVHPTRDEAGMLALTFEHPTMPGPQPGGWMVKNEAPVVAVAPNVCLSVCTSFFGE